MWAVGTFNPELFPGELLNKIASAIAATPFSLMMEALVIHFIYEIMREAGLRLPKPLGHAVSIVGALVIGDTAISAGLIGATTLMVVALTAICSYVIPNLYEPIAILRLLFIVVGGIMGSMGDHAFVFCCPYQYLWKEQFWSSLCGTHFSIQPIWDAGCRDAGRMENIV